jgi:hypothetical protein
LGFFFLRFEGPAATWRRWPGPVAEFGVGPITEVEVGPVTGVGVRSSIRGMASHRVGCEAGRRVMKQQSAERRWHGGMEEEWR